MEYKLVSGSIGKLADYVNQEIEKGWKPVGGPFTPESPGNTFQAMSKGDDDGIQRTWVIAGDRQGLSIRISEARQIGFRQSGRVVEDSNGNLKAEMYR